MSRQNTKANALKAQQTAARAINKHAKDALNNNTFEGVVLW